MRLIWWGGCGRARIFHHVNCLGVYDKYNVNCWGIYYKYNVNCWGIYYKYKATNYLKRRAVKILRPCKRAATTNPSKQGVWEFTLECNCLILYSNKVHTCLLAAHITIYLHSREAIWSVRAPCRPRRGGWRRWPGPAPATSPPWPPAGLAWAKTSDSSRPAQGSTSEASSVLILPPRRRWVPPAWETTPSLSASSLSSTSFVVSYFRWRDTSFSGVSEKPHRVETKKLWPVQILNSWKNWTVQKLNRGELKCSQRGELSCSKRKNWSVQSSILLQRSLSVQSLDSTPSICDILKYTQDTPLHVYLFLYLFVCFKERSCRVDEQVGQKQGNPINAACPCGALKRVCMYTYTRISVCVYTYTNVGMGLPCGPMQVSVVSVYQCAVWYFPFVVSWHEINPLIFPSDISRPAGHRER